MTLVRACYPGSFNPLTVAHLGIADAAREQLGVDHVELVLSEQALGKEGVAGPTPHDRAAAVVTVAQRSERHWLRARVTPARLLADIAEGSDWLVLGADKWAQLIDPVWYDGADGLRNALTRLPRVAVAPRPPVPLPDDDVVASLRTSLGVSNLTVVRLVVSDHLAEISSTAVRAGRADWHAAPPS